MVPAQRSTTPARTTHGTAPSRNDGLNSDMRRATWPASAHHVSVPSRYQSARTSSVTRWPGPLGPGAAMVLDGVRLPASTTALEPRFRMHSSPGSTSRTGRCTGTSTGPVGRGPLVRPVVATRPRVSFTTTASGPAVGRSREAV